MVVRSISRPRIFEVERSASGGIHLWLRHCITCNQTIFQGRPVTVWECENLHFFIPLRRRRH